MYEEASRVGVTSEMESAILYSEDIVNKKWNYYSMLLMKIRTVKKDVTNYTLSIPLSIKYCKVDNKLL